VEVWERAVPIRGTTLHVQGAGDGPAILFIHGMCGNADGWTGQTERLSGDFRCVAYDRRGHTRSPLGDVEQRSVQMHADDAAELIEALDLAAVVVVASSGGARIGVDMLIRHARLLRGAVLSEPAILGLAPELLPALFAEIEPKLRAAATPEDAVDAFFETIDPAMWAAMPDGRKDAYRANHTELLGDLEMPPYLPSPEQFASIGVPVRVICGELSLPIFKEVAARFAASVPGAELVELQGATHATYHLQPDAFAGAVRSFVTER